MQAQIVQKSLGSEYQCHNKNIAHGPLEAELCRRIFGCSEFKTTYTKSKTLRTHPLGANYASTHFRNLVNLKQKSTSKTLRTHPLEAELYRCHPAPPSRLQPAASFPNPSSQVLPRCFPVASQRLPRGLPELPEAFRSPQKLPEAPRAPQKPPRGLPEASQKPFPRLPRSLPEAPRSSQKLPEAPRGLPHTFLY